MRRNDEESHYWSKKMIKLRDNQASSDTCVSDTWRNVEKLISSPLLIGDEKWKKAFFIASHVFDGVLNVTSTDKLT